MTGRKNISDFERKLFFHFVLYILPLFLLLSCSTSKKVIKEPIKEAGPEYLFYQLKKNELKYNWFSAKFSADYIYNKKKTSFSGHLRIRKDSAIWISITPTLGIEMIRMLITPDSVKMVNRIEKTYFLSDFSYFNQFLNNALDFDMMQAFITGNDFAFYENGKFRASVENDQYKLITTGRNKLKKYVKEHEEGIIIPIQNIWLDPDNFKIFKVVIKEIVVDSRKFEATYSDFEPLENQLFPSRLDYEIQAAENKIFLYVKYSRVAIDKPFNFPFNVSDKYQRVY
ncbi:MAG: DUF4292 domain-containing protein [Bacteroidales bacterium]|nr:DUF4292 domain-containing protein [Bacteroidales bacterium]